MAFVVSMRTGSAGSLGALRAAWRNGSGLTGSANFANFASQAWRGNRRFGRPSPQPQLSSSLRTCVGHTQARRSFSFVRASSALRAGPQASKDGVNSDLGEQHQSQQQGVEEAPARPKTAQEIASSFDDDWEIVYASPLATAYRRLKLFSLSSAVIGTVSGPILAFMDPTMPLIPRLVLAGAVVSASIGTTVLLTLLAKPYVNRIMRNKHDPQLLRFTTLNFRAQDVDHLLRVEDINRQPKRPLLSNMGTAQGKDFYIHEQMAPECLWGIFPEARDAWLAEQAAKAEEMGEDAAAGTGGGASGIIGSNQAKAAQQQRAAAAKRAAKKKQQENTGELDFEMEDDEEVDTKRRK